MGGVEGGEGTTGRQGKEKEVIWVGEQEEREVEEEGVAWREMTG